MSSLQVFCKYYSDVCLLAFGFFYTRDPRSLAKQLNEKKARSCNYFQRERWGLINQRLIKLIYQRNPEK